MLVFSTQLCCPSQLLCELSIQHSPLSLCEYCEYTVYTYTVCKGGWRGVCVWFWGPQTYKQLTQSPFTDTFFLNDDICFAFYESYLSTAPTKAATNINERHQTQTNNNERLATINIHTCLLTYTNIHTHIFKVHTPARMYGYV
jgi:hypothetical protein